MYSFIRRAHKAKLPQVLNCLYDSVCDRLPEMKSLDERHLIAIPIIFVWAAKNKLNTDEIYLHGGHHLTKIWLYLKVCMHLFLLYIYIYLKSI